MAASVLKWSAVAAAHRTERDMSMLRPYIGPEEVETMASLEEGLHCPRCTANFRERGFVTAYWAADAIVYFCWCGACAWRGELWEVDTVTAPEAVEGDGDGPALGVVGEAGGVRRRRRS